MEKKQRIYLDNAATSWPKPAAVYTATDAYQRDLGAPAGRSNYQQADEVQRTVARTRHQLARLLGATAPEQVVFTSGGTGSLNQAIHGCLRLGDHVVTTVAEHNSLLRPLRYLEEQGRITVTRVGCGTSGQIDPSEVRQAMTSKTRLVAMLHVSNVTGAVQPVQEVGQIAREAEAFYLIDVAQSLGHTPIQVADCQADLVAGSGHKGLMGPLGLGVLYVGERIQAELEPLVQGGTGTESELDQQPAGMPEKYESGNLNVVGIVGLAAALDHLQEVGLAVVEQHLRDRTAELIEGFSGIAEVRQYGPSDAARQLGVVSINIGQYDPQEAATILDQAYSVQTRAGLHCAPLMHRALETLPQGGTLRFSPGWFTTAEEIQVAVQAVAEIAKSAP
ncbi:MAG TPA: aminotransferase class V-fold PLP-dependent enzyme [Planctomycetes bacterium]|nr:aminotransferase class V-fold PLP-dependent enzyme [Planctomycetaceae bacterium]HIN95983.1 aminotransferase class V-fold PLP-dependent enzyme [Planctomycetota bacterium]